MATSKSVAAASSAAPTLRAWRAGGRLLVECGECSSRGHPAAPDVARVEVDQASVEARALAQGKADDLRKKTDAAVRMVMAAFRVKQLSRDAAAARVRGIAEAHARGIMDIAGAAPGADDGVEHRLLRCPWCDAPGPAVVESLPDGAREPEHWGRA